MVIIFSKIIKVNFNIFNSQCLIKKTVLSLRNKKIIDSFRSSPNSAYIYFLKPNIFSSIQNVKKSKLFKILINIPTSVFQFYSQRYYINQINFNISTLKKQTFHLSQNFSSILQKHLQTDINSFTTNFRYHLKNYKKKLSEIDLYIKYESLKYINNPEVSSVTYTPTSSKKRKNTSFYPKINLYLQVYCSITE